MELRILMNTFLHTLKIKHLIADGAMGTQLINQGFRPFDCLEMLNITHPKIIQKIHQNYQKAGAKLLYTHTFGANPLRLKQKKQENQLQLIWQNALENIYLEKKDEVFIAANIGPSGLNQTEITSVDFHTLSQNFHQTIQVITTQKQKVDALAFETFTVFKEIQAAVLASQHIKIPRIFCVSPNQNHTLADNTSLETTLDYLKKAQIEIVGINCYYGLQGIEAILQKIKKYNFAFIILKPNAGIDQTNTPQIFATQMLDYKNQVKILGGCCGVHEEHIKLLAKGLKK